MSRRLISALIGLLAATLLLATPVAAQTYPQKSVRLVVPFAAGGIADVFARIIATTPEQFAAFVAAETAKWGKLIREVGIRAD